MTTTTAEESIRTAFCGFNGCAVVLPPYRSRGLVDYYEHCGETWFVARPNVGVELLPAYLLPDASGLGAALDSATTEHVYVAVKSGRTAYCARCHRVDYMDLAPAAEKRSVRVPLHTPCVEEPPAAAAEPITWDAYKQAKNLLVSTGAGDHRATTTRVHAAAAR